MRLTIGLGLIGVVLASPLVVPLHLAHDRTLERCEDFRSSLSAESQIELCTTIVDSIVRTSDEKFRALLARAVFNGRTRRYTDAVADCDHALRIRAYDDRAMGLRGYVHTLSGCLDCAIRDLSAAVVGNPANPVTRHNRAVAYALNENYELAVEEFGQAIALSPTLAPAFVGRGSALVELGQYTPAFADFDEAIRLAATNPVAYHMRCRGRIFAGRAAEALADCDQALELRGTEGEIRNSLAIAYFLLGQLQRAQIEVEAAIALDENDGSARYARGLILRARGMVDEADREFAKARSLSGEAAWLRLKQQMDRLPQR